MVVGIDAYRDECGAAAEMTWHVAFVEREKSAASTFFCVTTDDEINGTGRKESFALRAPAERPPNS